MKPGSVLVVGPIPPPIHGAARVTARVVANLRAAGTPVVEIDTSGTESGTGWRHHAIRVRLHLLAAALILVRRRRFASVYLAGAGGLGLWYQLLVVLAARVAGVPTWFHHHSFAYLNRRSRTMRMLTSAGGPTMRHVALCEGMAAILRESYPPAVTTRVASNAGLFDDADPADATRPGGERIVLGHLGNLVAEKGLPLVLDTLRRLRADGVPARLLLGGPARTDEAAAMLTAAQREFGAALEWLGPVPPDKVDDFYRALDVFVFPSTYAHEAEPMVVLEAGRLGVPTVAFAVGCLGALVPDADWLVPPGGDFAATGAELIVTLGDPDERLLRRKLVQDHFAARRASALKAQARLVADLAGRTHLEDTMSGNAPVNVQDAGYQADYDYDVGSPHLTHPHLRNLVIDNIREIVTERLATTGAARVLEIGAGHGDFTDHVLATGASVTVTEMSKASAELLQARYAQNPKARVVFDESGEAGEVKGEEFDVVLCISVLHHIPDYLAAIRGWLMQLAPGGAFLSFQDPLYYPRRSHANLRLDRGAYYAWRVMHGDLVQGFKSYLRRTRGAYDEDNYRDMVEYHVLRDGVDEQAIAELLGEHFSSVRVIRYWSTQSRVLQRLGERLRQPTTFGVRADGKRA